MGYPLKKSISKCLSRLYSTTSCLNFFNRDVKKLKNNCTLSFDYNYDEFMFYVL